MKTDIFQKMIAKYFQNIPNDTNSSLVLGVLLSMRNNGNFIDLDNNDYRILFDKYTNFVKANTKSNCFIEPFTNWEDVPEWYLKEFSSTAINFISVKKRNFYLPQYMFLELENDFFTESCAGERWSYHLLPDIRGSEYPRNKFQNDFTFLTNEQKSITAFYLAHDTCNGNFIYDPADKEESPFFWEYWHPYLEYFDKLKL